MITKDDVLASILHEIQAIKLLAAKLPPGRADWRPTQGQRSVLELLQYLSHCSLSAMLYIVGRVDEAKAASEASRQVTLLNFDRAMDRQAAAVRQLVNSTSAADFANKDVQLFWGTPVKLGRAFMDIGVKFLACYRMQLFLFLKQMGVSHIATIQNWGGVDPKPQPANA